MQELQLRSLAAGSRLLFALCPSCAPSQRGRVTSTRQGRGILVSPRQRGPGAKGISSSECLWLGMLPAIHPSNFIRHGAVSDRAGYRGPEMAGSLRARLPLSISLDAPHGTGG